MEQLRAPEGALIVAGGSRRLCRWGFEGNRTIPYCIKPGEPHSA